MDGGAWWAAVHGVAKSRTRLSNFTFTFHFHALEKEMATHSSTLAWKTPWTEEPGRLQSMGLPSRTRLSNFTFHFFFSHPLTFSSFQTWEGEQGPRFTDEQVESQSSLVISEPVPGCPCFLQQDAS